MAIGTLSAFCSALIAVGLLGLGSAGARTARKVKAPALFYAFAHVRDYQLVVTAVGARGTGTVVLALNKQMPDGSYEIHEFEVLTGARVREAFDLRSATVRASLGS